MRAIDKIIVHCSATEPSQDIDAKAIAGWHKAKGWLDIGYHYVIKRDGSLEHGRNLDVAGAHCEGRNKQSIGICLAGGVNKEGHPDSNFTFYQYITLHALLTDLKEQFPVSTLHGHREFSNKACPSFDVVSFMGGR